MNAESRKALEAFLSVADDFKLGELSTEQAHPMSESLSDLSKEDVAEGCRVLKAIDLLALSRLEALNDSVTAFAQDVSQALDAGARIFLCGCGATGRLSLSLEVLARQGMIPIPEEYQDRVIGFMAGGDAALIKSIERFEDYPEFGARQLKELGFSENDLLIAITEGGETPFVIGACEYAAAQAKRSPWFLYCNEDDLLCSKVERSRRVIEDDRIRKLNLSVGPMALSGSTRMQASTVQMAVTGYALFRFKEVDFETWLSSFRRLVEDSDFTALVPFVESETAYYQRGDYLHYRTQNHGITVLTDTTERSPTFSLSAFENRQDEGDSPPCLSYLAVDESFSVSEAWSHLLQREPRCLGWKEYHDIASLNYFMGFDISKAGIQWRKERLKPAEVHTFEILSNDQSIKFTFGNHKAAWRFGDADLLQEHLLLKLLLNVHSTLVMGRMGRYEGNVMTWVKPSNNKLIDRSIRYLQIVWEKAYGETVDYLTAADALYEAKESMKVTEPIVMKAFEYLKESKARR